MATVTKIRPLPPNGDAVEKKVWSLRLQKVEEYLKQRGAFFVSYPNGNSGWTHERDSMKSLLETYAHSQECVFRWERGNPAMCDVATLHWKDS